MTAALLLPRILDRVADRPVMIAGALTMVAALLGITVAILAIGLSWPLLLVVWLIIGLGYSTVQTPSGWLMTAFGSVVALVVLASLAVAGIVTATRLWPADAPEVVEHTHENLPLDHPHLQGHRRHSHALVIDDAHPRWDSQF